MKPALLFEEDVRAYCNSIWKWVEQVLSNELCPIKNEFKGVYHIAWMTYLKSHNLDDISNQRNLGLVSLTSN